MRFVKLTCGCVCLETAPGEGMKLKDCREDEDGPHLDHHVYAFHTGVMSELEISQIRALFKEYSAYMALGHRAVTISDVLEEVRALK